MKFLLLVASLVLISGCQSQNQVKDTLSPVLPYWVTSPPNTGELVVAIVPKQKNSPSKEFQLKAAVLDAKAQIARNRSSYIIDDIELSQVRNSEGRGSVLKNVGYQQSSLSLNFSDAKIFDQYIAKNGDLYILYGFK
tara:strand:- start:985 stop:1395 length:411 start_codon:yes stop_codon:yes gene_type:complete